MKDLNRYVTKKYASDWHDVGIELGLKLATLAIIKKDHHQQSVECFQSTLDKWLNSDGATWEALEVALTNVKRANIGLDPVDTVYGKNTSVYIHMLIRIASCSVHTCMYIYMYPNQKH